MLFRSPDMRLSDTDLLDTDPSDGPTASGSAAVQGPLWDAGARDWADLQECQLLPLYEHAFAHTRRAQSGTMLNIGCGAGLASLVFAKRFAHLAGVDASGEMVRIARTRLRDQPFRVGEMERLPFVDGRFDVVAGFDVFQYAASPLAAVREAKRVTAAGGLVALATWGLPQTCEAAGHLQAIGRLVTPNPSITPSPFVLSEPGRLEALAATAGLVPLEMHDVECPWVYRNRDTALRALLAAGHAARAIHVAGRSAVERAVLEAIEPYRQPSGSYRMVNHFRYLIAQARA
jgi:SAM-dependent methyltransferase